MSADKEAPPKVVSAPRELFLVDGGDRPMQLADVRQFAALMISYVNAVAFAQAAENDKAKRDEHFDRAVALLEAMASEGFILNRPEE